MGNEPAFFSECKKNSQNLFKEYNSKLKQINDKEKTALLEGFRKFVQQKSTICININGNDLSKFLRRE